MRVFHVIARLDIGGAERVALNIASNPHSEVEYHIVEVVRSTTRTAASLIDECQRGGVPVHRFIFPNWQFHYLPQKVAAWLFPLWFLWVYRRHRPDVIHTHTEIPDLAVCAFFKLFPGLLRHTRVVRTIHNNVLWSGMRRVGGWVERFMQRQQANVAISQSVRDSYERAYGVRVERLIYNGVAEPAAQESPRREDGKIHILFAGRFEQQKGIDTLISIVSRASAEIYTFTIVGAGRMEETLRAALAGRGNVTLLPAIPHLATHLARYDYLLMPSLFEGLPLLPIEAALARVPVLANLAPGLRETLPEEWLLAVHDNDEAEWDKLFAEVLPHADRSALAEQLHAFALAHFSLQRMRESYEDVYRTT